MLLRKKATDILNGAATVLTFASNRKKIDPLTKLRNVYALKKEFSKTDAKSVLALINIDRFSGVNATYGIDIGDTLLCEFCNVIKKNIPKNGKLYRYHGDEFIILLKGGKVHHLAEMLTQIEGYLTLAPIHAGGFDIRVSFSSGISFGSGEILIKEASTALMQARADKARFRVYSPNSELEKKLGRIFFWQSKLKDAMAEERLVAYYQPMLNNKTGEIDKFESLIRLRYDNKIVMPVEFLEAAKECGMLGAITRIAISDTFRKFAKTKHSFSVNITEQDLLDKKFVTYIEKKLELNKIEPFRVYFELLEGISTDVATGCIGALKEIKKLGCKISVDDFGTEHSNFRRLLELDVDLIKIDGGFIKNLDTCDVSQKIVRAIMGFANSIGAKTAAEFVHSAKIQQIVKEMEIDYSQGYYIGVPSLEIGAYSGEVAR